MSRNHIKPSPDLMVFISVISSLSWERRTENEKLVLGSDKAGSNLFYNHVFMEANYCLRVKLIGKS